MSRTTLDRPVDNRSRSVKKSVFLSVPTVGFLTAAAY